MNLTAENAFVQQGDTHNSPVQQSLTESLNGETHQWLDRDANCFLHQALSTPVMNVMSKAEGVYIFDQDGNRYLDCHGNGVHNVGFNNPEVINAVKQQLDDQLTFTPRRYTSKPAIEFAEKLIQIAPEGLDRVLFCPGGSEAIEMAIMLAKHVTGKWKTISFCNQYHGNTFQAATLSGNSHFSSNMGPMVPGAFHVDYPNYYRNPWGIDPKEKKQIDDCYLHAIKQVFKNNHDVAAVLGTTISSTPYVPSDYFWQEVRRLCDENETFLIFDEIVCGLGRSGKFLACEHYVTPDVVVLGKSLGGGILPYAGILTKERYNTTSDYSIGHYTHEKSPICAAAGLATLNYIENNNLVDNAAKMGQYLLDGFTKMKSQFVEIGQVDGKGLLISLDLIIPGTDKERNYIKANNVLSYCLQNGLSFKIIDGNVITLRPALVLDQSQADFILDTIEKAFANT